ncbi:MAG: ABC transporter substrate-binding protein [Caldilineaceae bacterium]
MTQPRRIHPAVLDAANDHRKGKINRRDFLRFATLLGASVPVAYALAGCSPSAPAAPATGGEAAGEAASMGGIKRGGTWTASMQLQLLDHPARLSWVEGANIVRQMNEYLTETGPDNITRPLLLDRWEASDDVKTWDLYLKQGILFNNGDELQADDVMFTMGEWLNPDVGSSMLGLLGALGTMDNVEKVDDYHIRLHLDTPDIAIPESLFHYPAVILHRGFEGDIVQQPVGTGPFLLQEYAEGERARFTRREDYWRMGEDGDPLPYLDELIFVSTDKDAGVAALQSGQVDTLYDPRPSDYLALTGVDGLEIRPVSTAQCLVLRMRGTWSRGTTTGCAPRSRCARTAPHSATGLLRRRRAFHRRPLCAGAPRLR